MGVLASFRQRLAYMDAKCCSSCALVTIISTAPVRQSISRPIPQSINAFESLSNFVRDSLFRMSMALRKISSLPSSPSPDSAPPSPLNTLAFQRVSSLTSRGLQSSSAGAVSCLFFFFSGLDTSPPIRPASDEALISARRVSDTHRMISGGLLALSSSPHASGASIKFIRIARRSFASIRFTAFCASSPPSPGLRSSVGKTFPLDQFESPCGPASSLTSPARLLLYCLR
mmetsp:Transcript_26012/g.58341  ORF Transcript_26012/g.58341 Transcript_26012/m.58341 type:complete len:229 (+) Transcript_26012:134-820(+)